MKRTIIFGLSFGLLGGCVANLTVDAQLTGTDGGVCVETDPNEHPMVCLDGLDNDCDGATDCEDPDCFGTQECDPMCGEAEDQAAVCFDNHDQDCDGLVDCADPDCAQECGAMCTGEQDEASCTDGQDNDCDGFTDCDDPVCVQFAASCGPPMGCTITPLMPGELTPTQFCFTDNFEYNGACGPSSEPHIINFDWSPAGPGLTYDVRATSNEDDIVLDVLHGMAATCDGTMTPSLGCDPGGDMGPPWDASVLVDLLDEPLTIVVAPAPGAPASMCFELSITQI